MTLVIVMKMTDEAVMPQVVVKYSPSHDGNSSPSSQVIDGDDEVTSKYIMITMIIMIMKTIIMIITIMIIIIKAHLAY